MAKDPRNKFRKPPFPQITQEPTGSEETMTPKPDSGANTYKGFNRLKGKTAIITGGDSGIGRAVAIAFAKEGADVVISFLESDQDAKETIAEITQTGRKGISIKGDIQDENVCKKIVDHTLDELGEIDILVNNAAFQMSRDSILDIPSKEFDRVMKTNIYGMFYLTKAAYPHMQPGSSIINTASIQAYDPSPNLLHYAMTKAAQVNFTQSFSQEAIKKGIRVNAVAPGPIWTPLIAYSFDDKKIKEFGKQAPMQRPGQPVEVAHVFVFLASDEASFVTGQIYGVTGGEIFK